MNFLVGLLQFHFGKDQALIGSFKNIYLPGQIASGDVMTGLGDLGFLSEMIQHVFCLLKRNGVFEFLSCDSLSLGFEGNESPVSQ